MPDTIARLGRPSANYALDCLISDTNALTPDELADLIRADGITGERGSADAHPVGLWVVAQLACVGAASYSWVGTLLVYNAARVVIAESPVDEMNTIYQLECIVNDLSPEVADLVEGEPLGEADRAELAATEQLD